MAPVIRGARGQFFVPAGAPMAPVLRRLARFGCVAHDAVVDGVCAGRRMACAGRPMSAPACSGGPLLVQTKLRMAPVLRGAGRSLLEALKGIHGAGVGEHGLRRWLGAWQLC